MKCEWTEHIHSNSTFNCIDNLLKTKGALWAHRFLLDLGLRQKKNVSFKKKCLIRILEYIFVSLYEEKET